MADPSPGDQLMITRGEITRVIRKLDDVLPGLAHKPGLESIAGSALNILRDVEGRDPLTVGEEDTIRLDYIESLDPNRIVLLLGKWLVLKHDAGGDYPLRDFLDAWIQGRDPDQTREES